MSPKNQLVVPAKGDPAVIRFPKGMLKKLSDAAAKSGRSRNSEIVYRLSDSLKQKKQTA